MDNRKRPRAPVPASAQLRGGSLDCESKSIDVRMSFGELDDGWAYELRDVRQAVYASVRIEWNVQIPLRDGVRLNATAYLPRDLAASSPAIFTLTPYIAQTYHDRGIYFAAHGYPFLAVDVRGRGNSEGRFEPNINEAKDGHDVVEWLARQAYCNGNVAMWGGSYAGYSQWATAKEFPAHLATIVPAASPCIGVDFPMPHNIPTPYLMQWLALVSGRALQDAIFADQQFWNDKFREWLESGRPFRSLDLFLGHRSEIFQEWLAHPQQDSYWDSYNPTDEEYTGLSLPILTITGQYDGNQTGALAHYRKHLEHAPMAAARHYLVIGPWDHAGTRTPAAECSGIKVGPASLVDLPRLHLQWYAWAMQSGPRPEFLRKNVTYYVMGAETWRYADTLAEVTQRVEPMYLRSTSNPSDVFKAGSLSNQPASQTETGCYVYDPRDISLASLESKAGDGPIDHRMIYASSGRQLVYQTEPFVRDTEISGFFELSLWLSIDQPDTDVRAAVYEVGLDGSAIRLTASAMRARHREGLREAKLIDTTAPLRYDFRRFTFVSRQVKAQHRLRLVIGPINSIYSQKNYNSGGVVSDESMSDARPVTVRLLHDSSYPSALYVPLGRPET
jgi:uncharacterized protein